jgi:hypothetical protein
VYPRDGSDTVETGYIAQVMFIGSDTVPPVSQDAPYYLSQSADASLGINFWYVMLTPDQFTAVNNLAYVRSPTLFFFRKHIDV